MCDQIETSVSLCSCIVVHQNTNVSTRFSRHDCSQKIIICVNQCDNAMWDLIECSNTAHGFLRLLRSKTSTDTSQKESWDKSTTLSKHFTTMAKCENDQQVHEKLKIKMILREVTAKERHVIRTRLLIHSISLLLQMALVHCCENGAINV